MHGEYGLDPNQMGLNQENSSKLNIENNKISCRESSQKTDYGPIRY